MIEQNFQKPEITEYLLGALPAAETEKFDELSFTDDEFAGALDAAEKDLIDDYVRGELDGETLAKFKSVYLASPLRRKKVEFAETFHVYGEREKAKKAENFLSADSRAEKKIGGIFSFLNIFKFQNRLPQLAFGFAALLIAAIGGFWLLTNDLSRPNVETAASNSPVIAPPETNQIGAKPTVIPSVTSNTVSNENAANRNENAANRNEKLPPLTEKEQPKKTPTTQPTRPPEKTIAPPKIIVASFSLLPSLRGANQIKSFSIPKNATEINVNLELETDDFTVYQVALTDESGSVNLWRSSKIKAAAKGENKSLPVRFPAKLLKSKIYTLVVSGVNPNGETEIIGSYPFRSVLK